MSYFIYNVTVRVEDSIVDDWQSWMKNVHIPDILATNCFTGARLLKLLDDQHNEGAHTFAVQYHYKDQSELDRYLNQYASLLREEHLVRYGEQALAFRTTLEVLCEY